MNIPWVDLPAQSRTLWTQLHGAFSHCLRRGDFVLGRALEDFETAFARYCGTRYGVGVASGTDALTLGLQGLGIGRGDEVITTAYSFIATAEAIALTGARPVLVDIDPQTYTLDPGRAEAAITRRTRALLVVHLYGQPAEMDRLLSIARRHRLAVIEDCAQAHGATYGTRRVGSFGAVGAFSFYPTKNLGALGDGGMVVTNRRAVRERVRLLRDHGRKAKDRHTVVGCSSRLDTLQASVLRLKLRWLNRWNQARIRHARRYTELLQERCPRVETPVIAPGRTHVFHLYVVRVPSRDHVLRRLNQRGIQALVHYPVPYHLQPSFASLGYRRGAFPVAERMAREALSLPMYPGLTDLQIRRVVQELAKAGASRGWAR